MVERRFWLANVLNILMNVVQALIGLYIVLRLFGAREVPFVRFIAAVNRPLLAPFAGMFRPVRIQDDYVLELSALFALMIYSLIGFALIKLALMMVKR
ncbi:YggT family protein [Caenibacillus caldisaponilyticus]|uniref:YggT family protein n=1 Tax=Caenibacillus caldisaponilyticus TaxID=1674942 RepID=UPI0009882EBB|nr:YggT family protein [Caenibacillus caldisaponilyticus]